MLNASLVQAHATLPEYFGRNGYRTISQGKIFHKHFGFTAGTTDDGHWAFEEYQREGGVDQVNPAGLYSRGKGLLAGQPDPDPAFRASEGAEFEWGPLLGDKADMRDSKTARWAAGALARPPGDEPFFLAVGFHQPHLPWFVPQEFYDRHPLDRIQLPVHRDNDLEDIRTPAGRVRFSASQDYRWLNRDPELYRRAVQAYLAAISYADECVGMVLEALERSPHRDNTIVVIFGDHGWHLGEKLRFRKATLWQEATRLPLLVRTPGMNGRRDSPRVVNLIDLYPTLVELCGLPTKPAGSLDGRSLVPLLKDPAREWPYPTLVTNSEGDGAAVISEQGYYIRYGDGTTEYYDMRADPLQWTNLSTSTDQQVASERERLAALFPAAFAAPVKNDGPGAKRGPPDPAMPPLRAAAALR